MRSSHAKRKIFKTLACDRGGHPQTLQVNKRHRSTSKTSLHSRWRDSSYDQGEISSQACTNCQLVSLYTNPHSEVQKWQSWGCCWTSKVVYRDSQKFP